MKNILMTGITVISGENMIRRKFFSSGPLRTELIDKEIGLEAYELAISPDDDRVHSLGWKDNDLTFLLSLISDKPGAIPSAEVLCAAFDQRWYGGPSQRQSLKFLRREEYIEPGYNNKGYDVVNNLGYAYYKTNSSETKFTVKDLKEFLHENNVPDDTVLKICYEDCCEAFPCKLLHDRNKNELVIVE